MSNGKRTLTGIIIALALVCLCGATGVWGARVDPAQDQALPQVEPTIGSYTTVIDGRQFGYCGNGALESDPRSYDRVVFVVHGNDRRACGMAGAVLASARMQGESTRTLIIAPWFALAKDLAMPGQGLHWTFYGWSQGDPSVNRGPRISSFDVMDRLAVQVDKPRTVVGFSGGAQFIARYSAATAVPFESVVIADPSTYLYFTAERPGTSDQELAQCPEYNRYRYGMEHRNPYMANVGEQQLTERFLSQNTTYLLGEKDRDPKSLSMDNSCGAMAQGRNRLERGQRYYAYLHDTFGPNLRHKLRLVPEIDHDAVAMFTSDVGRQTLFPVPEPSSATWSRWVSEQETG